ncbi:hypothetical protein Tco_0682986 [Tanacetum coccineum]|uniref:Retrovirus-related Pol polyprotein from transposon TNT 1-94-like beta-barrel domain-containing protein n=1 Tax=Tanacetum coccineum TaxID=301880 RepID=A0ABQ4XTN2_9ASTR
MSTANQQTLAELGAENRPPILEKESYVPWANIKVMNYILQGIPNDIYNSVDACKDAQTMEKMLLATKYEDGVHLDEEENDFMPDNAYGDNTLEELYAAVIMMQKELLQQELETCKERVKEFENKPNQFLNYKDAYEELQNETNVEKEQLLNEKEEIRDQLLKTQDETLKIKHETDSFKKAFKERENKYLEDIVSLEEKLRSHDRIVYKMSHSLQTIHMLDKKPNKVYDPHLKTGLGYENPERLKKVIKAQPKIYNGNNLNNNKVRIDLPDYKETLEGVEENQLKMKDKIIPLDCPKLNALYESFVPQTLKKSDLPPKKMPNESKLLIFFVNMDNEIKELGKLINIHHKMDKDNNFIYDIKADIRRIFTLEVVPISRTLNECSTKIKQEITTEKNEILMIEMDKISNKSKDIQANLLKRIKILENDFQRSQAQSIDFELKLQHQKEKITCDISWKSKMAKFNGENVSLNIQIESLVQEREKIKLEYQKLFNSIKTKRVQHQREVDELIENVNQNTYAYGDVRSKNQDLFMTISELKAKLKTAEKGKNVNTMLMPKPVTSNSKPKNEQDKKKNANVLARGMYRVIKTETQTPVAKSNMFSFNSTGVASFSSVRRPNSKDNNLKKRVLQHTKSKSTSKDVKKSHSSVSLVSNKHDTLNSNVSELNANVLKAKTVSIVHHGLNLICVSCGNDVFMISHDKCVARYALFVNSRVKRALFTSLVAAKSSKLRATTVVAKSSGYSKHMTRNLKQLRNFVEKFMGTVRFGNDHFAAISGYRDYVQGNLTICHVYYVKGLGHNLFSVGQFCNGDLEVAFRYNTCYVRNLEGEDLLTGSRDSNLYTISISEMTASSSVCLMSKAT